MTVRWIKNEPPEEIWQNTIHHYQSSMDASEERRSYCQPVYTLLMRLHELKVADHLHAWTSHFRLALTYPNASNDEPLIAVDPRVDGSLDVRYQQGHHDGEILGGVRHEGVNIEEGVALVIRSIGELMDHYYARGFG
jgi:hypothetical protein